MRESIKEILHSASELDSEKIQTLLKQIIPTYVPRDFVGPKLDQRDNSLSKPRIKAEA